MHFDWPERFAKQHGALRPVVERVLAIRKCLAHLGLSTPEAEKPPPLRQVLRVAEQAEGWGVPAEWD
jgi:hypothetical protein